MLSKSDKKRKPMRTAALLTREALEALVTHQERRVGRVNAYKDVADTSVVPNNEAKVVSK